MDSDREVRVRQYAEGHQAIIRMLRSAPSHALDSAASGEWSVRQIVHHLADTEVFRSARLRRLLSQDQPVIQAFDESKLEERIYYYRDLELSLALFDAAVRSSLEILGLMSEEDWAKTGRHTELGEFTMRTWLEKAAEHLPDHAGQIQRALAQAAAPSLSLEATPSQRLGGWPAAFLARHNSARVASRGRLHEPANLSGFAALRDGEPIALATYRIEGAECEMVTLHSDVENAGAGSALVDRIASVANAAGCSRLWLITTNDNTHALRFYQRRGFRIAAVYAGALDEYRSSLKPEIPATGNDGIPLRDEIEMEMSLALLS